MLFGLLSHGDAWAGEAAWWPRGRFTLDLVILSGSLPEADVDRSSTTVTRTVRLTSDGAAAWALETFAGPPPQYRPTAEPDDTSPEGATIDHQLDARAVRYDLEELQIQGCFTDSTTHAWPDGRWAVVGTARSAFTLELDGDHLWNPLWYALTGRPLPTGGTPPVARRGEVRLGLPREVTVGIGPEALQFELVSVRRGLDRPLRALVTEAVGSCPPVHDDGS